MVTDEAGVLFSRAKTHHQRLSQREEEDTAAAAPYETAAAAAAVFLGGEKQFRSVCRDDMVPDAARGLSWDDPLYENDPDVIAAFDVAYEKIDRSDRQRQIALIAMGIPIICTVSVIISDKWSFWSNLLALVALLVVAVAVVRKGAYRKQRLHVAVARRGVYVDEVAHPGICRLMRRQVIAYDRIIACTVEDRGWFWPTFNVVLMTGREGTVPDDTPCNSVDIPGLEAPQTCVDIIKAVKMRSAKAEATKSAAENAEVLIVNNAVVAEIVPSDSIV